MRSVKQEMAPTYQVGEVLSSPRLRIPAIEASRFNNRRRRKDL